VQRCLTIEHRSRHPHGYVEQQTIHFPYDTMLRLHRERPDIVVSAELGARTIQAALYLRRHGDAAGCVGHRLGVVGNGGRGAARRLLRRALLPCADAVPVNGRSGERYVGRLGARAGRIVTGPYTPGLGDLGLVAVAPGEQREARRLLYVGQLIQRKGMVPFVAALGRWGRRHPGEQVTLEIVGDGEEAAALGRLPLPRNVTVRCRGHLPYEQIAEAYARASLFVFPTLADEWGLVVNEAMAAGLPVLGSIYSQAVEELVVDGVTRWVFEPDHREAVDTVLGRALELGRAELAAMGAKARDAVCHLTPDLAAERLVEGLRVAAGC
jgi:glycosyltransferase involved in cell wall biosynthesis